MLHYTSKIHAIGFAEFTDTSWKRARTIWPFEKHLALLSKRVEHLPSARGDLSQSYCQIDIRSIVQRERMSDWHIFEIES
ncbi:MAG: hypothetical protein ACE5PV_08400 [Candidatus Poribacteria bacterium]